MPQLPLVSDAAPEWVTRLANDHGLGLVPWSRLVCQALQLAAEACQAKTAALVVADRQMEHLLVWPQMSFLSVKAKSRLVSPGHGAQSFFYSREEMRLSVQGHPWISRQSGTNWCAGRSLPAMPACDLGSIVLLGSGTPLAPPLVQERLRAATNLLAAALTGRPANGDKQVSALMSRREFDQQLSRETRRSERSNQPLGILLATLTCKSRKHGASDAEVQEVGEAIARLLRRGGDFAARYGSRSIAILLPDSDQNATAGTASMLNAVVAPLVEAINEERAAPLGFKLVTTSVRGYSSLAAASEEATTGTARVSRRSVPAADVAAANA